MKKIDISVVVPVYREEEIINDFYNELIRVMEKSGTVFEIIFVNDDFSNSETMKKLEAIHNKDNRVVLIGFTRNYGHQMALTAGIDYARGDAVVMLDADLQHPPELILTLIDNWKKGYDIVYTIREDVLGETLFKKLSAKMFYFLMSKISDIDMGINCADFRLMSRKTIDEFKKLREKSRFIRGLVGWMGYRKIGVPYIGQQRNKGTSKYSLKKILSFALNGLLSFSDFPIRIISVTGLIISSTSFLYLIRVAYYFLFTEEEIPNLLPITTIILFLCGIQMLMLGIIGEYIAKIYTETKNRPLYLIDKIYDKIN
ncbi:MAG: glycosyltransferase family 2 protein [Nitrospirae bacterium]|nr:glycosyltransferase family 2 protein [Nitrospirota bacterium]